MLLNLHEAAGLCSIMSLVVSSSRATDASAASASGNALVLRWAVRGEPAPGLRQNSTAKCDSSGPSWGALLGALLGAVPLGAWPWDALTEGDAAGGHATPLVKRALNKAFVAVCSVCEPCAVTAAALWLHSLTAHLRASCVGCNADSRNAAPATPAFRFPFSLRAKPEFIN